METDTALSRRRLLASATAVAAAGVPSVVTALAGLPLSADDLVYAAIEREKSARAAYEAAKDIRPGLEFWEGEKLDEAVTTAWFEALRSFRETQPRTARGLVAFLDHFDAIDVAYPDFVDDQDMAEAFQSLVPAIRAVLRKLLGAQS
jgi:hypothetical protein